VTSSLDDSDVSDDDDYDAVTTTTMTSSPPASASAAAVEGLRALVASERSRRRSADDWATFLVATLDAYVRASGAYHRRGRLAQSARPSPTDDDQLETVCDCRQTGNASRPARREFAVFKGEDE